MLFATAPLPKETKNALDFLIQKASSSTSPCRLHELRHKKGGMNSKSRDLYDKFACPEELADKHGYTVEQTGEMLTRLRFLQFDFESQPSDKKKETIRRCRSALRSGKQNEAQMLWERLLHIASEHRPIGGSLDRIKLLSKIINNFELKDLPNHTEDWGKLLCVSNRNMNAVHDSIGGNVRIERDKELIALQQALDRNKIVIFYGEAGVGKSVITKKFAQQLAGEQKKCLWFEASYFEEKDFDTFQSSLQLQNTLENLLSSVADQKAYCVFDGLDRLYDERALETMRQLARYLKITDDPPSWRMVITCQTRELEKVYNFFKSIEISSKHYTTINCEKLSSHKIESIWNELPKAIALKNNSKIGLLLGNLKIFDLIARRIKQADISNLVSEVSVAEWFWQEYIAKGQGKREQELYVMNLASRQADKLLSSIPLQDINASSSIRLLEDDYICKVVDHKVSFTHELYGNWSRLQAIIAQQPDELSKFLDKCVKSPVWHEAIKLYATSLLESDNKIAEWKIIIEDSSSDLLKSILLEAIIFIANPLETLNRTSGYLFQDKGKLLKLLLKRFIISASNPNPLLKALAEADGSSKEDIEYNSSQHRITFLPLLQPMLIFLHQHKKDTIKVVPNEMAKIIEQWLNLKQILDQYVKKNVIDYNLCKAAAELGLMLGRLLHDERARYIDIECCNRKICYQAALAGAVEIPDEVVNFALEASGRTSRIRQPTKTSNCLSNMESMQEPWQDGPKFDLDNHFRLAVLRTNALHPLMRTRPEIAREIILATLIEAPKVLKSC